MRARLGWGVVAAGLLLGRPSLVGQAPVADPLVVSLVTMGPGALIEERFGHNAIWIRDTVAGTDLLYNFGMFDYNQPNFLWNFVKGRPQYWLDVWSLEATLRVYAARLRTVEVQELALSAAQKASLAASLAFNADPANRTYTYDYYRDNCSTRVRDALDAALGGALRLATVGRDGEGSYRFHTQRSTANNAFYYLGIEAAMGRRTDQLLDQWDEMFLPAKVQERLRELRVTGSDGRDVPLVTREATLLEFSEYQVLPSPPDWTPRLLFVGALLALLLASGVLPGAGGVAGRIATGGWAVATTLASVLLVFLGWFTNHVMTGQNLNLLLLSPLAIAILPLLLGRGERPIARRVTIGYLVLLWLGALPALAGVLQHNREIAALVLLPGTAAAWVALAVSRRRAAAPPVPR